MIAAFLKLHGSAHLNMFEAAKKLSPKLRGLAALTPPENEITRGDVIAGAKMNAKMKNEAADAPMDSDVTGSSNINGPKIPKPVRADKANQVPMDSDVTGSSNIKGPKIPAPVPVKEGDERRLSVAEMAGKAAKARAETPAPGAGTAKNLSKAKSANEEYDIDEGVVGSIKKFANSMKIPTGADRFPGAEILSRGINAIQRNRYAAALKDLKNVGNDPDSTDADFGRSVEKMAARRDNSIGRNQNENVQWSDAELAHIQSILEANPIAPTPDEYSGPKDGPSIRNLTDETKKPMAKKAMKEESELEEGRGKGAGRGRPAGAKSGAGGEVSQGEGGGGGTLHPTIEIRSAFRNDKFKNGKVTVTHPETGEKAQVPKEEARIFYGLHHSMKKAADRLAVTHKFLEKHFGHGYSSDDNAEAQAQKDDTAGSAGYSAPSKVSLSKGVYINGVDRFGNKL
jgi:hypothetical protein